MSSYSPSDRTLAHRFWILKFARHVHLWHSNTKLQMVSFLDENTKWDNTQQLTRCSDAKFLAI